jgi:uncharacterized protein YceK
MRRAVFVLVAVGLTGCGTIANVGGGRWRTSKIYGGVLRDVQSAEDWIADYSAQPKTELKQDVGVGVGVGLIAIDLPLSAVADTLTLPITIPVTLSRPRQPDLPPPPVVNPVSSAKAPAAAPKAPEPDPPPKREEKSARDAKNPDGSRR